MAMSAGDEQSAMATINTTPLVDVMLVLLIIFLITIPVITKTVPVKLPKAVNIPTQTKPENITIAVDKDGNIYWNDTAGAQPGGSARLREEPRRVKVPQPEIHIRGDKDARYEAIGRVMYAIQRGGIVKVGFLTEPDHGIGVPGSTASPEEESSTMAMSVGPGGRGDVRHQHDAADRRHAGAAGHADHHAAGDDARGQARHAATPTISRPRRLRRPRSSTSRSISTARSSGTARR